MTNYACFKAYDIRGPVPDELNEELSYNIGRAYVAEFKPNTVVVGYDIRLESKPLASALKEGLKVAGATVIDIGLCGTEEVYFGVFSRKADGGIMVTASHNPKGHNGMKLVRKEARPISQDTGLERIKERIQDNDYAPISAQRGQETSELNKEAYINHLLSYINQTTLKPLKLVMNPGNGAAGAVIKQIMARLPFEVVYLHEEPDGHFPNGVPNPMLEEYQRVTANKVQEVGANLGVAWDGDFDRCFLFDETGEFVESGYLVGLLAKTLLAKELGANIVHDTRLRWNTEEEIKAAGGHPIPSISGHSFMKDKMREVAAIYGGEISAHHYFKDFSYCDSGMIPWLLIVELLSQTEKPLSALIAERKKAYPCSGERNYQVDDIEATINRIVEFYQPQTPEFDDLDGVSLTFKEWRINIRASNTEPLLRLNIESRGNADLIAEKVKEVETLISCQ